MSLAILCPGQGAQKVGMGVDVADRWPAARAVFDEASDVLGLDLLAVCRDGPESELVRTDLQQPAILAVGAAIHAALVESGRLPRSAPGAAFGLSLGEFTALHVAGALSLRDALVVVRERGLGMQEASEANPSGLTALRCETEDAEAICASAREQTGGVCSVANINAPGQIVISGDLASLDAAEALAKERGIRRATRLPVAGAFHSVLMEPGAKRLAAVLDTVEVKTPAAPIISNVTAEPTTDPESIRANLIAQVTNPVRFVDCVAAARGLGVDATLEVGPGRVLSGLVRRIDGDLATYGASDVASIEDLAPTAQEGTA
jgi:[acyl-carrier-protein] S-malonyltransferase